MNNKKTKQLKRAAEQLTVDKSEKTTRKIYRKMKKEYIQQQNNG